MEEAVRHDSSTPTGKKAASDAADQYQGPEHYEFTYLNTRDEKPNSYSPDISHNSEHRAVPEKAAGSLCCDKSPTHQQAESQNLHHRNNAASETKQHPLHEQENADGEIELDRAPKNSLQGNVGRTFGRLTLGTCAHCGAESITSFERRRNGDTR